MSESREKTFFMLLDLHKKLAEAAEQLAYIEGRLQGLQIALKFLDKSAIRRTHRASPITSNVPEAPSEENK